MPPKVELSDEEYAAKKARIKAAKEKMYAGRNKEKGLIIVHTGKGKGKSTAAWGLAMRCLGNDLKIGVVQFVKGKMETGERKFLERFPELVTFKTMGDGFTWETQDRNKDKEAAEAALKEAEKMLRDPDLHLVIFDELNIVLRNGALEVEDVIKSLTNKRPELHVVITGRNAKEELIEFADLVTEMSLIKHPFREQGIKGQLGVEF